MTKRVPLSERHKPWWKRDSSTTTKSSSSASSPIRTNTKRNRTLAVPKVLVASKRRPASATRTVTKKKIYSRRREYAIGAPPYQSGYTGRVVPARLEHNIARGTRESDTTAAVLGKTKTRRSQRSRPQSASVVRRRGGVVDTVKAPLPKYSPKAGVIIRRHASTMRSSLAANAKTTSSASAQLSTTMSSSRTIQRHASLGGPFTRSDPRMYGAPPPSCNPSDAAIYAVQTTPRAARLTGIELGRNQIPLTERALTIPPKHRSAQEGHAVASSFGQELRGIKDRIPTPAPQSLDKIAPDLQKAVLWPDHIVERSNWPKTKKSLSSIDFKSQQNLGRKLTKKEYIYRLGRACRLADGPCVAQILQQEGAAWINERGTDGTTALHHAAAGGASDIVLHLLLPCGANPEIEAEYIGTPLDVATQRLSKLQRSANPQDLREKEEQHQLLVCMLQTSSVWQACRDGDLPRVQHLLEFVHHDVDEEDEKSTAAIDTTAAHSPNDPNVYGMTPLHYACMGEQAHVIRYLLQMGAHTNVQNNLGQLPNDLTNKEWVHRALDKENRERAAAIRLEREKITEIENVQREAEAQDRAAWSAARGTSSAVPLAKRLQKHQRNSVALLQRKRDVPSNGSNQIDLIDEIGAGASGAQKRGVFASTCPTQSGRYLLAHADHSTKEIARRAMPSDRIVDNRRSKMEGASRLRHVRRLSHGDDTPKAVFREFWRFDARRTAKEAAVAGEKERRSRKREKSNSRSNTSKSTTTLSAAPSMEKRKSLISKRVTTTPNQGHPNTDSQAFNNWLRLHFGTNVPEARPMQKK